MDYFNDYLTDVKNIHQIVYTKLSKSREEDMILQKPSSNHIKIGIGSSSLI